MKEDLLLHSCCGPCASASVERLLEQGRKPLLYYSNSNISSTEEYEKRLFELEKVAHHFQVKIQTDKRDHGLWRESVQGFEEEREGGQRCRLCFRFNLSRSYEKARELDIPFSTTLSISPYKSSKILFQEGDRLGDFENHNFKKMEGYKRSIELSRRLDLYRQDWCGCEFSLNESIKRKMAIEESNPTSPSTGL